MVSLTFWRFLVLIGYARVSTQEQNTSLQRDALYAAGCEKLFEEKGMMYRALNSVAKNVRVPYGFSREANLIFKEAMTNTFNHSGAKNVTFTMKKEEDAYVMKLADDGKGFDKKTLEKMNGLKNMRTRAERIGGILYIQSYAGAGAEISLLLPIHIFKEKI